MKRLLWLLLFLLPASAAAQVTCYAVAPSNAGSANGSSWSNARGQIPATVRGTRYYLADGAYTATSFSTATSGTTTIEIRKAQSYDFGRTSDGCSNDISAGWNPATMGAGQATFQSFSITTAYYVFNGNGNTTIPGCGGAWSGTQAVTAEPPNASDCGISVTHAGGGAGNAAIYWNGGTNGTMEYVEVIGNGVNNGEEMFGGSSTTLSHMYMRYSGCVFVQDLGNASTINLSYFWGNEVLGGSSCHGQAEFEVGGTNNGVRSNNVYRDISGTAVWTFAASVGTNNNWIFYNNIIYYSSPAQAFGGTSDASFACINGNLCTNILFYHNIIVNCSRGSTFGFGTSCGFGFGDSASGGSVTLKDNLFYANAPGIVFTTNSTTVVEDYNSTLNGGSFGSNTHDVHVASGSPNPFTNWPAGQFTLASDNANWNNFISLGAPYDTDITGAAFTTDRGAYQFVSGGASFNVTPATVPSHHSNAITLSISGAGLTSSATFTISGVTGAVLSSCTNTATSGSCHLVTGSGTGTATITDTTDSVSTTITIATATLAISPSAGNVSTTPTLTLTNTNGLWLSETAAGLFTVAGSGCVGDSIATPTVTTNNAATAVLTTGSGSCTITITDTSTTATAAFTVAAPTTPTVTTGTAGSLTSSTALISSNSYVCTGSCSTVTSEGTCYGLTANPTTPCTSDGTVTPFSSSLTSLSAATTYHFRAFAANIAGTAYGTDQTFTTPAVGITYLNSSCTNVTVETGGSSTWAVPCTPVAAGDALVMFAQCHPTSGTITGITLTSPGWTINQLVPPASTGSNSWGALFGAIAPNTSAATFTATFTGGANCSNFSIFLSAEFSGNDPTGGATTFNATGSASGSGSTCNQAGATLTPPKNSEAVWYACLLGSATTATSPWTLGAADGNGNSSEYQILSGGSGVAQTPAFNGSAGAYVIEGVAINPASASPTCTPASGTYAGPQTVVCSAPSGSIICYDYNGGAAGPISGASTCPLTSFLYTGPINVSGSLSISAISGGPGLVDSAATTVTYTIPTTCGSPDYSCVNATTTPPGALSPAFSSTLLFNSTTHGPLNATNSCVTRFTDQNIVMYGTSTNISTAISQGTLTSSGGDNEVDSSVNTQYLAFRSGGGVMGIYQADPSGTCIHNVTNGGENPSIIVGGGYFSFSRKTESVFYYGAAANKALTQSTVQPGLPLTKVDTANSQFPFDWTQCPGSPGVGTTITTTTQLNLSAEDAEFVIGVSYNGNQGTSTQVYRYRPDRGCRTLDVAPNGASSTFSNFYAYCQGDCSKTGSNPAPSGSTTTCVDPGFGQTPPLGVHGVQVSRDGNTAVVSGACFTPLGANNKAWWDEADHLYAAAGTTSTWDGNVSQTGHNSAGWFSEYAENNPNPNARVISPLTTASLSAFTSTGTVNTCCENHTAWPSPSQNDSNYTLTGIAAGSSGFANPAYLQSVIIATPPAGVGTIKQFTPNWATGTSTYFSCQNSISYTSQDANWQVFITDDLNNLGLDGNGNPLCSVYVARLGGPSASGPAATPVCSPGTGIYSVAQSISCTDSSAGAVICYAVAPTVPATNGTTGCSVGLLYSTAFTVSSSQQVNVIAGGTGYLDSAVQSYTYTIGGNPVGTPGRPAIDILLNP